MEIPEDRQTDTTENITFPQTTYAGVIIVCTHIETRVVQFTLISMVTLFTGTRIQGFADVEAGTTVLTWSCVAGVVHITRVAVVTIQTLTSEGGVRLVETDSSVAVKIKYDH